MKIIINVYIYIYYNYQLHHLNIVHQIRVNKQVVNKKMKKIKKNKKMYQKECKS